MDAAVEGMKRRSAGMKLRWSQFAQELWLLSGRHVTKLTLQEAAAGEERGTAQQ
jgi:hypothetical protein